MKFADFEKLLDSMIREERGMRHTKGIEYALSRDDRLLNFKRIGLSLKCSKCGEPLGAKTVLLVYLIKHFDSIVSYVNQGKVLSDEKVEGRILDARVYLSLFRGLIEEEKSAQSKRRKRKCQKS